jgi:hypothetical protein
MGSSQSPQMSDTCGFAHAFTPHSGQVYRVVLADFFLHEHSGSPHRIFATAPCSPAASGIIHQLDLRSSAFATPGRWPDDSVSRVVPWLIDGAPGADVIYVEGHRGEHHEAHLRPMLAGNLRHPKKQRREKLLQ